MRLGEGTKRASTLEQDTKDGKGRTAAEPVVDKEMRLMFLCRPAFPRDDEVWRCLREMAAGLAFLHERGLVHRDLKPENVLLPSGRCVLRDFGFARTLDDMSRMSTVVGTFGYMAPEIH